MVCGRALADGPEKNNEETTLTEDGLVETNYDEVIESFDDMGLKEDLLRGIYSYGFEARLRRESTADTQATSGHAANRTCGRPALRRSRRPSNSVRSSRFL